MRNYEKELNWRKNHYVEIRGYIEKNLGKELKEKLKKENKTIIGWITENARKYTFTGN